MGSDWQPLDPRISLFHKEVLSEGLFGEDWWVVGAYLAGRFPAFKKSGVEKMQAKWQVFEEARQASLPDPVVFLLGVELSEHGMEIMNIIPLRKALAALHPEGFKMHMAHLSNVLL